MATSLKTLLGIQVCKIAPNTERLCSRPVVNSPGASCVGRDFCREIFRPALPRSRLNTVCTEKFLAVQRQSGFFFP